MYLLFWVPVGFLSLCVGLVGNSLGDIFGRDSGKIFFFMHLFSVISLCASVAIIGHGKRALGCTIGAMTISIMFAYWGWFALPFQTLERADERVQDIEQAIDEEKMLATQDRETRRYLSKELAARKLERRAVKIRSYREPSNMFSYILWFYSVIFFLGAFLAFRKLRREKEDHYVHYGL